MWSDRACSIYLSIGEDAIIHRSAMTTSHNHSRRIVAEVDGLGGDHHLHRTGRTDYDCERPAKAFPLGRAAEAIGRASPHLP